MAEGLFTPESVGVNFAEDAPTDGWADPPLVGLDDGLVLGNLMELAGKIYNDRFGQVIEQLGLVDIARTERSAFSWTSSITRAGTPGASRRRAEDGALINSDGRGYALRRARLTGTAKIMVSSVDLKSRRLGEMNLTFGYGEGRSPVVRRCLS